MSRVLDQSLIGQVENCFILSHKDSILNSEVSRLVVVVQRLVVAIAHDAHHRLNQRFARTHIPKLESRHQVQVKICLLIHHVNHLVSRAGYSRNVLRIQRIQNFIHTGLVAIHRATDPQIVIGLGSGVFTGEGCHRCDLLDSLDVFGELVFHKDSALGRAEISSSLLQALLIEGFVHNSDSWPATDTDTNESRDMVEMTLSEACSPVQRVNPDTHLILKEFIRKFVVVEVGFGRGHTIDLLQLLQIDTVTVFLLVVVVD